jgi:SRSO17 transposase
MRVIQERETAMKSSEYNTPPPTLMTLSDVVSWYASLKQLHLCLASHFARPEPYARALRFVQGILSEVPRKNGWQLAEQAREATPYGMQRLLSQAVWDADGVRDELRRFVLAHLGTTGAIIALDETSFPKRGQLSAGVKKQYCGTTGHLENCQVAVFLSYITDLGHTLIDRELYLPQEWIDDPARSQKAGIALTTPFRTKPQLAALMIQRLLQAHRRIDWVVADSVYGGNAELRAFLETRQLAYVMEVASNEPVVVEVAAVGVRRLEVREVPALLASDSWKPLSMSEGTKGPRLFDWACVPIWHQGRDDGWHSLLIRRPLDPKAEPTYYLVFSAPTTTLEAKVAAQGARWHIEEDFENGKDLGLDHYEVRSLVGWYRHITLVMLALAYLTALTVTARRSEAALMPGSSPGCDLVNASGLIPLTVPETRRLLARLLFPPPSSPLLVLAWSSFRRKHQQRASWFHIRRRKKAG